MLEAARRACRPVQKRGGVPFLKFPTERLGILGKHKLWPLAAVLQLLNIVTEGLEEFINYVRKITFVWTLVRCRDVCLCVCLHCVLGQDSLALLSSAPSIYGILGCSA